MWRLVMPKVWNRDRLLLAEQVPVSAGTSRIFTAKKNSFFS